MVRYLEIPPLDGFHFRAFGKVFAVFAEFFHGPIVGLGVVTAKGHAEIDPGGDQIEFPAGECNVFVAVFKQLHEATASGATGIGRHHGLAAGWIGRVDEVIRLVA